MRGIFNLFLVGLIFLELALSRCKHFPGLSIKLNMVNNVFIKYLHEMNGMLDNASYHSSFALIACSFYFIPEDEYLSVAACFIIYSRYSGYVVLSMLKK
jgi:hypothetical protein